VSIADLKNINHPINQSDQSGKTLGRVVITTNGNIPSTLYYANGNAPADLWFPVNGIDNSYITPVVPTV
jgi:hypothetical protein